MKILVMKIAVLLLRISYALLKLFPQKDKITLISGQSGHPTDDMRMLADELRKIKSGDAVASFEVKLIAARMGRSAAGALAFTGGMLAQMYHIATARFIVVERSNIAVNALNHKKGTFILQIWHAPDAIKKAGWQVVDRPGGLDSRVARVCCVHRNYDKILCPSHAVSQAILETFGASRYGYDESTLVYLGLPRIDRITEAAHPDSGAGAGAEIRARILEKYPIFNVTNANQTEGLPEEHKLPVILYAPTFRDGRPTEIASLLHRTDFSRFHLVLKLHPLDDTQTPAGRFIADRDFSANDWFSAADVIVTDYSGMAVEAAVSGIPTYFYLHDLSEYERERGLNVNLTQEVISPYIFTDPDSLMKRIEAQFDGTSPYDATLLHAFRRKYAEFPDEGNTEKLARYIVAMMSEQ